jgi:pyridoxal phosphate enzyme (YggS family)
MNTRIKEIRARIDKAARIAGRDPEEITLIAVSKGQSVLEMNQIPRPCIFGENYIQEYKAKKELLNPGFEVHFIGALQSNKAAQAVKLFDVIESVGSARLANIINKEAEKIKKRQAVFLQVNISDDENKGGFSPPELLQFIAHEAGRLPALDIKGLMTITRYYENPEDARPDFRKLRQLAGLSLESLRSAGCLLSMGMSQDFEIAIEEGASIVRVGTAIFGERR